MCSTVHHLSLTISVLTCRNTFAIYYGNKNLATVKTDTVCWWWLTPLLVQPAGALQPRRSLRTAGTSERRHNSLIKFMLVLWGSMTCSVWFRLDASLIYALKTMCSCKIQLRVPSKEAQKMTWVQVSIWQHLFMLRYDLIQLCYYYYYCWILDVNRR